MSKGQKIDRQTAERHFDTLINTLGDSISRIQLLGSYRRKKELLGDLDVIIELSPSFCASDIRFILKSSSFDFISGKDKHLTVTIEETQIDLYITTSEHWASFQLFLTGSGEHNIRMRVKAKKMGYKLNQYGLWKGDVRLDNNTEQSIYSILNLPFLLPSERTKDAFKQDSRQPCRLANVLV